MKKHKFIVEIEIPKESNITIMRNYIDSVITNECKLIHPRDPMYGLNSDSIKVTHATRAKAAELLEELKLN